MLTVGSGTDRWTSQALPNVVFVVTVRNNRDLLDRCLRSVARQRYPATRCVVMDDVSDDGSAEVASTWARTHPDVFRAHLGRRRRGKMENFAEAVSFIPDHDVVVELDGDDRLLAADVAGDLARLHLRADVVWTQHRVRRSHWRDWVHWRSTDVPAAHRSGNELPRLEWSRSWYPGHLRSFKAWAFKEIDEDDLKIDGKWVGAAADVAYFCPLLESTPPSLRYFYDRECAEYTITAANDHFGDEKGLPGLETQRGVAELLFSRQPRKVRRVRTWIGDLRHSDERAIFDACLRELDTDPALRVVLGAAGELVASPHPRIQVLRLPVAGQAHVLRSVLDALESDVAVDSLRMPAGSLPVRELG
ncbi:glycosyltransferase family 2 protein [Saccharothrix isguenensis]